MRATLTPSERAWVNYPKGSALGKASMVSALDAVEYLNMIIRCVIASPTPTQPREGLDRMVDWLPDGTRS